jgi:two-component system chemotaxis response regulator CheY
MAWILVIDANPRVRAGVRHILEYAGYGVLEACDGGEGVSRAQLSPIGLVILGLQRPARVEAIRLLQAVRPTVKLLAMVDDERTDARAERLGGSGVSAHWTLQKPVGAQDLLAVVQTLLTEGERQPVVQ